MPKESGEAGTKLVYNMRIELVVLNKVKMASSLAYYKQLNGSGLGGSEEGSKHLL